MQSKASRAPSHHLFTPALSVVDGRGLPVRGVDYWCSPDVASTAQMQARISRTMYDPAGRAIRAFDPRLWTLANLQNIVTLSGKVARTSSVDAGWRINLAMESGQLMRYWDSRGSVARFEYDSLLRPVAVFEREQGESERCVERLRYGGREAGAHNLYGQLIRHDDPAGSQQIHEASLSGDVLQQSRRFLLEEVLADWPLAESQRDELLEPGAGAVTRQQYSVLAESLTQTDAKGNRQRCAYSVAGQLHSTWLLLAGQRESDEQVLLSAISYNAFGQVETETAGNGVVSTARYCALDGRLEHLLTRKVDARLQELTYGYDPVGNILSIQDDVQPVRYFNNQRIEPVSTYQYDTLYQLTTATGRESVAATQGPGLPGLQPTPVDANQLANYTQRYTYDAGGNLTSLRHVGAQSYTLDMQVADDSNRSVVKNQLELDTAFDANGNLQQLQPGQSLTWDLRNQLRKVTPVVRIEAANDDEVYAYDGDGQRVRKTRRTQAQSVMHRAEVRYLPGLELRTNTATGETLQVISVTAGRSGVRVLHWEAGKPDELTNDQVRYSLSDHLGSSSLELDQQAQLISQEGYYPYGGTAWWAGRNATEAKYKTIRYSGKERDATGLCYYGLRYYAPWLNRWINPDPAGDIDGLNLFRMCRNNPVTFYDVDGRAPETAKHYHYFDPRPDRQGQDAADTRPFSRVLLDFKYPDNLRLSEASVKLLAQSREGYGFAGVLEVNTGELHIHPLSSFRGDETSSRWMREPSIDGASSIKHNVGRSGPSHRQLRAKVQKSGADQKWLGFTFYDLREVRRNPENYSPHEVGVSTIYGRSRSLNRSGNNIFSVTKPEKAARIKGAEYDKAPFSELPLELNADILKAFISASSGEIKSFLESELKRDEYTVEGYRKVKTAYRELQARRKNVVDPRIASMVRPGGGFYI